MYSLLFCFLFLVLVSFCMVFRDSFFFSAVNNAPPILFVYSFYPHSARTHHLIPVALFLPFGFTAANSGKPPGLSNIGRRRKRGINYSYCIVGLAVSFIVIGSFVFGNG